MLPSDNNFPFQGQVNKDNIETLVSMNIKLKQDNSNKDGFIFES